LKYLLNDRIPASRKINKEYSNTVIATQKIWIDSMQGAGVVKHKGGEAGYYACRLGIHFGGTNSHGTKRVIATSKKRDVIYGIEAKISVFKNQIDCQFGGIAMEGKIVSTPHGFIGAESEDIDQYKKDHLSEFRNLLGDDTLTASDFDIKKVAMKNDESVDFNYDE